MAKLNPFPDYPVVPLKANAEQVRLDTVRTPAIAMSRGLIDRYVSQWRTRAEIKQSGKSPGEQDEIDALVVGVLGDYGTGKTHLLLDALAQVQEGLGGLYPSLIVIRVPCIETDPYNWFEITIGPELSPESPPRFIENLITQLYAAAGQQVAGQAKLTEAAVKKLQRAPDSIHSLVKEDLLSVTEVDQKFDKLLRTICADASENVKRALGATIWRETATSAVNWLMGQRLDEKELSRLRLTQNVSNEVDVHDILVSLAAIHKYLDIPFGLMVDELEHLTRYDQTHGGKRNITWFKRLIEGLATHKALLFISGHWSAWQAQHDYLDRFTQLMKRIELVKLTGEDVLKIVKARVSPLPAESFGPPEAATVAESSNGNLRRILSLCRVIFRETDGFSKPVTSDLIRKYSTQITQKMTVEDALPRIHDLLERQGLNVVSNARVAKSIPFDLVGFQSNHPRVVVELKHATHQLTLRAHAKEFIDHIEKLIKAEPDVIGCFIADGNIDDDLLAILNETRPFEILWYDLSNPNVLNQMASDLEGRLNGASTLGQNRNAIDAKAEREQMVSDLEDRIRAARDGSNAELLTELQKQREALNAQINELQARMVAREDDFRKSNRAFQQQLQALEQRRAEELKELYESLAAQKHQAQSERDVVLMGKQEEEENTKLHLTYTELTRSPALYTKLRLAISGSPLIIIIVALAVSVMLLFLGPFLAQMLATVKTYDYINPTRVDERLYTIYRIIFYIFSLLLLFGAMMLTWQRLTWVDTFFDYSGRMIREIYLRESNVKSLLRVDSILRNSFEKYSPRRWKIKANERLAKEFPEIFGYLLEEGDDYPKNGEAVSE
jgi:hypothetical protein